MKKLLYLVVLLTAGCATARQTHLQDGQLGYTLDCSGTARSWNMCLEKAGELCGARGYKVLWSNSEQGVLVTATQYGMVGGTTHPRNMVVRCNSMPAAQPETIGALNEMGMIEVSPGVWVRK